MICLFEVPGKFLSQSLIPFCGNPSKSISLSITSICLTNFNAYLENDEKNSI